jgi:hypothetical protein
MEGASVFAVEVRETEDDRCWHQESGEMGGKTDFKRICIAFTQNPSGCTVHHMEQNDVQAGSKETSNANTIHTNGATSRVHLKKPVFKKDSCFII